MKSCCVNVVGDREVGCMYYGCFELVYGKIILFCTEKEICGLHFLVGSVGYHVGLARSRFRESTFVHDAEFVGSWKDRIVGGGGSVDVLLRGTVWQRRVWEFLLGIRVGKTVCYEEVSRGLGCGRGSARAVGSAVGENFVGILVPCHRVVRKDGGLGGYRWGVRSKVMLLEEERRLVGGKCVGWI